MFPTEAHRQASQLLTNFFSEKDSVEAVLLVNSCARGKATRESDLDMAILVSTGLSAPELLSLEESGRHFTKIHPAFRPFHHGPFVRVHLDCFTGNFAPQIWDDGGGADVFDWRSATGWLTALLYGSGMLHSGNCNRHGYRTTVPLYRQSGYPWSGMPVFMI